MNIEHITWFIKSSRLFHSTVSILNHLFFLQSTSWDEAGFVFMQSDDLSWSCPPHHLVSSLVFGELISTAVAGHPWPCPQVAVLSLLPDGNQWHFPYGKQINILISPVNFFVKLKIPDAIGHSVPIVRPHILVKFDISTWSGVLHDALVIQLLVEGA